MPRELKQKVRRISISNKFVYTWNSNSFHHL